MQFSRAVSTQKYLKPGGSRYFCGIKKRPPPERTGSGPVSSARKPAERLRAESKEIPAIVQFSPQGGNERWREFQSWTKAAKSIFHISKQCHPLTGLPILIGGRTLFHSKKAVVVALI